MTRSSFTASELQAYRGQLQVLVRRLGGQVDSLISEALRPVGAETSSSSASFNAQQSDLASVDAEESRALAMLEPEEHILADAIAALKRIEDGTFGRCEACGKGVARARLDALPYARRCVRCEKITEAEVET